MVEVRKKDGEHPAALLFRFSKKVRQSGVLKEFRKRRFHTRPQNRRKRLLSAGYREAKAAKIAELKKLGLL